MGGALGALLLRSPPHLLLALGLGPTATRLAPARRIALAAASRSRLVGRAAPSSRSHWPFFVERGLEVLP